MTDDTRALIEEARTEILVAIGAVRSNSSYPGEALAGPAIDRLAAALEAASKRAAAWEDMAHHLRGCRECGEMDVETCSDGAPMWHALASRAEPDTEEEDTDNGK